MRFNIRLVLLCLSVLVFISCTRKSDTQNAVSVETPEQLAKQFVDLSASASELADKQRLQSMCSGSMYDAFGSMPDEVFRLSYLGAKIKVVEFKVLETIPQGEITLVRYHVVVQNDQGTDPTKEASERELELIKTDQGLKIRAIRARGSDTIAFTRGMIF